MATHSNDSHASVNQDANTGKHLDAGAIFVLESKGTWLHAGYHLTASIVGPQLLSLPFAFASLGWGAGIVLLAIGAAVTFYSYNLLSLVLEHLELKGNRHLRFSDVTTAIMGPRWGRFVVGPLQFAVCCGAVVSCTLLGGQSLKFLYKIYHPNGEMQLYLFIILFGGLMLLLAQMPSFHSLRYINLASLLLCFSFTACAVGGSIHAGISSDSENKDYSLVGSKTSKFLAGLNSFSIIATTYGNGIIPEIQATIAPPISGKMFKALCVCYTVVVSTYFSAAISGYWAFGNKAQGTIYSNFAPVGRPAYVPNWFLFMANIFILLQTSTVTLTYFQPAFAALESRSADVEKGRFSMRNVVPRLIVRSFWVVIVTLVAAMLPFFGDINAVMGAFGIMPLDFILPMVLYNITFKPSRRSLLFWVNSSIGVLFSVVGILSCFAAARQIVLDANTYKLFANV
ncbi:hypothetical protein SUGI_1186630 [Cryptomeria japonica]|uniref:GABA transporter 1 n=1 Tax=Cryptomeria japonica TaxID=3369 RepID=UPI002414A0BE|nr:GABA transporter 1 [Cryptomeria japonica]GLJ55297.1 hypothetical protein SUGI_1186630 [Cryptomeria japonica]